jgi:two-component system sensor histidine kinase KdpD
VQAVRRWAPFGYAVAGTAAITAAIAVIQARTSVGGLSTLYLLLVLWLGATWGRWPAVTASVLAFLFYDFFFVPPVGTFTVRGPSELIELFVLLAVALVTGQLAGSLRRAQAESSSMASQTRALYELATVALKAPEVSSALNLLCGRALAVPGVSRFALASAATGRWEAVAGSELSADDLKQAAWSFETGHAVGVTVSGGTVKIVRTRPAPPTATFVPMAGGVAVLAADPARLDDQDARMLAALIGLAGLLLDRRRAGAESERARGLEASDRLKAAVMSSLSHELKSPIAALRAGLTALSAPRAGLTPEQGELVADMDRQATRLDRMVGDMLVLSRLEAGVKLEREPHGFVDLVATAQRQLRQQLSGHELKVEVPDDLPPVEVDEVQAARVVYNLLENATEWATPGTPITVGARARDGILEAWVENEGPAIPPVDLEHVFETFWSRRARGSGLGLAISRRVVEAHGGTIRAENMRGGPRFTFTLPLAPVTAAQ